MKSIKEFLKNVYLFPLVGSLILTFGCSSGRQVDISDWKNSYLSKSEDEGKDGVGDIFSVTQLMRSVGINQNCAPDLVFKLSRQEDSFYRFQVLVNEDVQDAGTDYFYSQLENGIVFSDSSFSLLQAGDKIKIQYLAGH